MPLHASGNGSLQLTVQMPIDEKAEAMAAEHPTQTRVELALCPELLLTGLELEKRTTLRILHKKGRRFESPWEPFFVGVYAHALFYYAHLGDWPRAVVPLQDADVKAVDRIVRHGGAASEGDDCGPCWKVTTTVGRVLLFRAPSHEARVDWIEQLRVAAGHASTRKAGMDGKAALALARRLSRSSSSASATSVSPTAILHSPQSRRRRCTDEYDSDASETLRDALRRVEEQRLEIEELQKRLEKFQAGGKQQDEDQEQNELVRHAGRLQAREERDRQAERLKEPVAVLNERDEAAAKGDKLDLDAMLDDTAIEMCKLPRISAISDVLSEDDNSPATEDDDDDHSVNVDRSPRESGRDSGKEDEDLKNMSLGDESVENCCNRDDEHDDAAEEEAEEAKAAPVEEDAEILAASSSGLRAFAMQESEVSPTTSPKCETAAFPKAPTEEVLASSDSPASLMSAMSINCYDAAENESIQQQAAELVEMARNLNRDELTDSSSTRESSDDGSLTSSFKGSHYSAGIVDSSASADYDFLQQQAMEIAEIARNLQSSFREDHKPATVPLKKTSSESSLLKSSFSDVIDFGLNQINSNDSNGSIFSITQDDLFFDEDEDGEIERLSEFEASDSQFLEASGFLDSIHQVMKDFIVSSQTPEQSRQPDQLVISDEIIAEIRQEIDAEPSKETTGLEKTITRRSLRMSHSAVESSKGSSPQVRSLFSHARSARGFLNGDFEVSVRDAMLHTPKDLPSLLIEDTMSVVASILQSAGREDKVTLLAPFLRVYGSRNRLSHLIRWAIEIEVASVINVATLFRSDDYASRLVSTYSKAIGSKFIRVALSDPIRQIFKLKIADMELNPHKEESVQDEAQADSNAANLMQACQNIIDSIMKNTHYIPSSYFHICSHLNSKVISRFDGSKEGVQAADASTLTRSVIGGFLFLRFVCPAITTPHLYGLTKQLPPPETRRVLVLVTKLLFKTATGVKFGDREPQFKVLNPFIEKNSPAIQQLFANLAMSPSQDIDECFASDSRKIYSHVSSSRLVDDLEVIRSISEKNLSEIEKKLENCDCAAEVSENFKMAVLSGNDPLRKSSLTKKLSVNIKFLSSFGKKPRKHSDL